VVPFVPSLLMVFFVFFFELDRVDTIEERASINNIQEKRRVVDGQGKNADYEKELLVCSNLRISPRFASVTVTNEVTPLYVDSKKRE
jgi:hypothetical protein